ncbi:hypothetical protein H6G13_02195 [Pseudanabaena sp. FACHB-2040]|nr:hypothetical protein [Pseudanabaena sp. FACHB-2040]
MRAYLLPLAIQRNIAPSTQTAAFNAMLLFYTCAQSR